MVLSPEPAYVTGPKDVISVVDTVTNQVVATIPVGGSPSNIAVTHDGARVYASVMGPTGSQGVVGTIAEIDAKSLSVIATIPVPGATGQPSWLALSPDGARLYVTQQLENTCTVIDTASRQVIATIGGFLDPQQSVITPDGSRMYIANSTPSTVAPIWASWVWVIDLVGHQLVAEIAVGGNPSGVAMTLDGTRVYVTNTDDRTVSVIDTAANALAGPPIQVGSMPTSIAMSPVRRLAYVTNSADNTVSVIDTALNQVIATISVGSSPSGIAVTLDGARVYVVNNEDDFISVIDTGSNVVMATIPLGRLGGSVCISRGPTVPFRVPLLAAAAALLGLGVPVDGGGYVVLPGGWRIPVDPGPGPAETQWVATLLASVLIQNIAAVIPGPTGDQIVRLTTPSVNDAARQLGFIPAEDEGFRARPVE